MPYITKEQRAPLDLFIGGLSEQIRRSASKHDMPPSNDQLAGVINYVVTRVMLQALNIKRGQLNYASINAFKGILSGVYDEFEERLGKDYEKAKRQDNGDVPEYEYHQPEHDLHERDLKGRGSVS